MDQSYRRFVNQRLVDDISTPPVFWVYYGRTQLLLARDYFGEERAKVLQKAIEFLSWNIHDFDTRIMIGILKAEIYINGYTNDQRVWFEIGSCFTQQGSCLDSQLHYALCLAKRIFTESNGSESYREVLRLLGARYLARFESIAAKAKTNLWWRVRHYNN
jgi:ATP/maltotriose-dependent transcriptional regulator MalT